MKREMLMYLPDQRFSSRRFLIVLSYWLALVVINERKRSIDCVYVREDDFFPFFFSPQEKRNEWAKKIFALFFLFFSSSLINACRRERQMNFLFFSLPLISNRNERKAKRENEKKIFSFFSPSFTRPIRKEIRSSIPDSSYQRTTSVDRVFQQFFFFLFSPFCRHALASFLYTQNVIGGLSPSRPWLMIWKIFVRIVQSTIAHQR